MFGAVITSEVVREEVPTIAGVRRDLAALMAQLDVDTIAPEALGRVVDDATAVKNMAAHLAATAAARLATTDRWKTTSDKSPAHELARRTGTSLTKAKEDIDTATKLRQLSAVTDAVKQGALSPEQAAAIADAAAVNPAAEKQLLDEAAGASLAELRTACLRAKAAADPDPDAAYERLRRNRRLSEFLDAGGAWNLRLINTPEWRSAVMPLVTTKARELRAAARAAGAAVEPFEAYLADALLAIITGDESPTQSTACPDTATDDATGVELADEQQPRADAASDMVPPTAAPTGGARDVRVPRSDTPVIRVDHRALIRGRTLPGEISELDGIPIPVARIRALIDAGMVFVAAALCGTTEIITIAHLGRRRRQWPWTPASNQHPAPRLKGATVIIRVRPDDLTFAPSWFDTATEGSTTSVPGIGPLPDGLVEHIRGHGDPALVALLDTAVDVSELIAPTRYPTAHQHTALLAVGKRCAVRGCASTYRLERDHRHDHADTHVTRLAWMDWLCWHHHQRKTHHGWMLTDGIGPRPFIPPGHPDHPRQPG